MPRLFIPVIAALFLCSCAPGGEEPRREPSGPAAPGFYYDLGPSSIDVSSYPKEQRENYKAFIAVCTACHGAARALNSPYTGEAVWKRYLERMRVKMESLGIALSGDDEKRIRDFLVYDSKLRKLDRKAEFESRLEELKKSFEESQKTDH